MRLDAQPARPSADGGPIIVEVFVTKAFNGFELASVAQVLEMANRILDRDAFAWRFSSDTPGLVASDQDTLVRAEPAIGDHRIANMMVVVGGAQARAGAWLPRARAMQRKARLVVLLSDAATAYIKAIRNPAGPVTTHWRDASSLHETGYYPTLTNRLSERTDGVITAAGAGSTAELMVGLITEHLTSPQVAELGNRLLLHTLRKSDTEQPKDIADNEALFDRRVTQVIKLMEDTVSEPMSISELTRHVGLSTRHLERVFRSVFDETPARFYKRLRVKRARVMIEETLLPMVDVAIATGFGSSASLATAVKAEFGITPSKMRARKSVELLKYDRT